jgi:hypothetical protein
LNIFFVWGAKITNGKPEYGTVRALFSGYLACMGIRALQLSKFSGRVSYQPRKQTPRNFWVVYISNTTKYQAAKTSQNALEEKSQ